MIEVDAKLAEQSNLTNTYHDVYSDIAEEIALVGMKNTVEMQHVVGTVDGADVLADPAGAPAPASQRGRGHPHRDRWSRWRHRRRVHDNAPPTLTFAPLISEFHQ